MKRIAMLWATVVLTLYAGTTFAQWKQLNVGQPGQVKALAKENASLKIIRDYIYKQT